MNEKKVARICWNTNNWQRPSGSAGKVAASGAYEAKTGYGHEEWLFDISKLVNGYHYAYIQAIGQHREKYADCTYDISFYTINSKTKDRWWLGEIIDVQVVSEEEAKKVYNSYRKNGWLREMHAQLDLVGASVKDFKSIEPEGFCCIKFEPKNMNILEEPLQFSSSDPAIRSDYYNLKNKVSSPALFETKKFVFSPGGKNKKTSTKAEYRNQNREIDLVHNQMQLEIYNVFMKQYGESNVASEHDTGCGTKIDIVVRDKESCTFYELKTANTAKQSIREALTQLLEYAYYPDGERAKKLVIISPAELTKDARLYLKNIRSLFKIPVFYQSYDLKNKNLGIEE
ncbi:hypothetical protein [Pseudomonas putida]|uniref:hypothetical protein n=1 Tax=Pseudomonas putida TaxID=303 RepID=UPI000BF1A9EA|nr:hypothetical protein [Pseudomonas putida]MDD2018896.1 hypothetical protein [Pseudomonas putida]PEI10693.1 hypothetical protein CRM86_23400 [Pseudomonas putida]